jgi:hypothetical protein
LKEAVRQTGRPINAVAKAAGIPNPVLFLFMTGERGISLRSAEKLADYFGLGLTPRK